MTTSTVECLTEAEAQQLIALGVPVAYTVDRGWHRISEDEALAVVARAL